MRWPFALRRPARGAFTSLGERGRRASEPGNGCSLAGVVIIWSGRPVVIIRVSVSFIDAECRM
eukprot:9031552-Lingulodinium_polyedra.AAC.1